MKDSKRSEV